MNNKKYFVILIVLMLGLVLFGCSNNEGDITPTGKTTIKFWNGFTGPDGVTMQTIVDDFNRTYKEENIIVMMDKLPWDTLYQKLLATTLSGTLPDVISLHGTRVPDLVDQNRLLNLTDEVLSNTGFFEEDYIPYAWDAGIFESKRYSLPLDVHPVALYYNKKMLQEAGFNNPPATWEEFLSMSEAMTTGNKYGYALPSMYSITKDMFITMLYQKGGTLIDPSGDIKYNSTFGVDAAQYLQDLVHKYKVSPKDVGAAGDAIMFKQGRSAFYFDGPWMIESMREINSLDFGVAPFPYFENGQKVYTAGTHQLGILNQNKEISEEKLNAILKFINYVNEHSIQWGLGGQVPAKLSVLNSAEYKADKELAGFAAQVDFLVGLPKDIYFGEVYNRMGVAISTIVTFPGDTASVLNTAVSDTKKLIEELKNEK